MPKLSSSEIQEIITLTKQGKTSLFLAAKFNVHHTTILYHLKRVQRFNSEERIEIQYPSRKCDFCNRRYFPKSEKSKYCSFTCQDRNRPGRTFKRKPKTETTPIECDHKMFFCKCSICGQVLGSEVNLILTRK